MTRAAFHQEGDGALGPPVLLRDLPRHGLRFRKAANSQEHQDAVHLLEQGREHERGLMI